jgi:hypothetical protein
MSEQDVEVGDRKGTSKKALEGQGSVNADEREEFVLSRLEDVRAMQRAEGNFDCFGRASANYCDRKECLYHAECLSVSTLIAQTDH